MKLHDNAHMAKHIGALGLLSYVFPQYAMPYYYNKINDR